ncbi:hypothetical protein COV93_04510 [Candidatus Woesearchaeota archaeon CG11_big_fil_rev_8_21_14_0_20_43_8]|nr:MAG: hypothetical protein COV93_04510 [Candidatus Woesearchaeota archaeon CG11_big_fil_rev_8_21_14_0_20_43_8]PIO05386.1 MAG: hypothetical protein COT47_05045 [Candidatus Woesearchaeota archaeon CG08_land_8_20_14_0_20_43_7]
MEPGLPGGKARWALEYIAGFTGGVMILPFAGISNAYYKWKNKRLSRKTPPETVVFTSGFDHQFKHPGLVAAVCDHYMYTPVVARQHRLGRAVKWVSNATKETVLENLANEQYQNVVFIGHGSNSTYCTTDGDVTSEDIIECDIRKKDGELIQHTCGGGGGIPLREALLSNTDRGYTFERPIWLTENYIAAWTAFFGKKPTYK